MFHRPTIAGISGNPKVGAWSIALSGGYEDDVDMGEALYAALYPSLPSS